MRCALLALLTAGALWCQPNPRDLVRQSIRNGEAAWKQSFEYECVKRDVDREFTSSGKRKNVDDDVYQIIPLGYGSSYEMPVTHNGEPVPRDQQTKARAELARRRAETPAQKRARFAKLAGERSYMKDVADAFDFKIAGEENLPTGPAWVVEATPRPGYHARSRYGHMFPNMRGKLWIDKKDVQWVKADALATQTVSFGFFIARLAKGSHIIIEQMRLPDGAWVPKRIEAKASARTFLLFNHNFEEDITYSNYRKPADSAALR